MFDDSRVGKVTMNMYHAEEFSATSTVSAKEENFDKFAYPSAKTIRYPKVGRVDGIIPKTQKLTSIFCLFLRLTLQIPAFSSKS